MQSNDSDASSSLSSSNIIQYGPIQVRLCRRPAPTIATGRRSKHLVLIGAEAAKREKRREKNREAARKLKEKRQCIEYGLSQKLQELQGEHINLQNYLQQLQQRKTNLQEKVNNFGIDPLIDLLSKENQDFTLLFEECIDDLDLLDESVENTFDFAFDFETHSKSMKND
ncbi:unnamed protein product [Rotaria socialis]